MIKAKLFDSPADKYGCDVIAHFPTDGKPYLTYSDGTRIRGKAIADVFASGLTASQIELLKSANYPIVGTKE